MRSLACLRHEVADDLGIGEEAFAAAGVPLTYVDLWRCPLPSLQAISGLVVLGGDMNVDDTDQFPFLSAERDLLAQAVAHDVPVLGICLGAQLLARALGASVRPSPARELGFTPVRPAPAAADDPLSSCFIAGDRVFQWHRDTFGLPEGAALLLVGDQVHNQAFRAGKRAWGFQFHLEITRAELKAWLDLSESQLQSEWGRTRDQLLQEADRYLASQQARAGEVFRRFAGLLR